MIEVQDGVSMAPYTTLKAGGKAEQFAVARKTEELAEIMLWAEAEDLVARVIGWGSNLLPSDDGVPGLTVVNLATKIHVEPDGFVEADSGCSFQELFLKTAQSKLMGLEFAVGIPGTLGGALVSNAGAYRSNVSEFLTEIEIAHGGERKWVDPSWMQFQYRDSILRQPNAPQCALLRVRLKLPHGDSKQIYDEARDYQRQRIGKQPPPASAGSFFKNVNNKDLAQTLDRLPPKLKEAGVIPSGFLIEEVGLRGFRLGGAALSRRHANFIVNVGNASAREIRSLAEHANETVQKSFGVALEEEVLYFGDWSKYQRLMP